MAESGKDQQVELHVQGMTWMGWEPKVVSALEELQGVKKASAHFSEKKAVVIYDPASVTSEAMGRALLKAGYVASPKPSHEAADTVSPGDSGQAKEHGAKDLVCYCFRYTKYDIEQDLMKNGRSQIMEEIMREKKTGGCDCANLNPRGRWCLPDVRRVVEGAKT